MSLLSLPELGHPSSALGLGPSSSQDSRLGLGGPVSSTALVLRTLG